MKTHNFTLVNADTDSISFCKDDQSEFSKEEQENLLKEINSTMEAKIRWEHDGIFKSVIILKAKNYVLKDETGKVKIKGSALKSSKTEPALKAFMGEVIEAILSDSESELNNIYHKYIRKVYNLKEIGPWCSKKTITEKVLNPERTNEQKILDAIDVEDVQPGDKIYMYFAEDCSLKQEKHWTGDHHRGKMLAKLWNTLKIFQNVIKMEDFKKYHLKNKKIQAELQEIVK